jgi:hypothetical protein
MSYMKKISIIKTAILSICGLFLSLAILQCRKVGENANYLDRGLLSTPDSGIFAPYYDTTIITPHDAVPDVNDLIVHRGVKTIIKQYCGTSNCHGGPINPKIFSYTDIMRYVTPGNPTASKLWEYITTNDFNKAMPPINSNSELSLTDKTLIYNWILNGAKEFPGLVDYRTSAIKLIVNGCGSANCHNQGTAAGGWARRDGLIPGLATSDTVQYVYTKPGGAQSFYCQLVNVNLRNQVWTSYKDSVKKFYADTVANAGFRPVKTFAFPVSGASTRGPLNTYDDILMDIMYPKNIRSNSTQVPANSGIYPPVYTDPVTLKNYWAKGNYLNSNDCFIRRIDSTLIYSNVFTGVATSKNGSMAYQDGGLKPSEIALIKAWYFADPNIPTVWKYGTNNVGIFKYRNSGTIIKP